MAKKDINPFADLPQQLKTSTSALNVFKNAWNDAFEDFMSDQKKLAEGLNITSDSLKNKMIKSLQRYQTILAAIPKSLVAAAGAIKGFGFALNLTASTLKFGKNLFQSLASTILGLVNLVGGTGMRGLHGVFKFVLKALREGLEEFNRNLLEVMHATEAMRATFGDLGEGIGKAAMNMAKGASIVNKIGGRYQDQLDLIREALTGVGAAFEKVTSRMSSKEQRNMGNVAVVLARGFGLTAEQLEALGRTSLATGERMGDLTQRFMEGVKRMADFTKISKKSIAKDVAAIIQDVNTFGVMTLDAALATAAGLRDLGIEAKKVAGVVKGFDTFKDAAMNVGLLNQVFDVQLDAYKMFNEQDPTKRIEMMRTAFFRTGQVFKNLPRQQQQYLAQLSHMEVETAQVVYSQKNMVKSYADIQKEAKKARSPQEKMNDVLVKLKGTLAKILKYFKTYVSFGDAITEGIKRGLGLSEKGSKLFGNYQMTLQGVMQATQDLVKWSLSNVPGLNKLWEGFINLFDPKKSNTFIRSLSGAIKDFFAGTDRLDWKKLFGKIKTSLIDFVSPENIRLIKDSAISFVTFLRDALAGAIDALAPEAATLIQKIADWFSATKDKGIFTGDTWFDPLLKSLSDAWDELKDPLFNLLHNAFDWAVKKIQESDIWKGIVGIFERNKGKIIVGLIAWFAGPAAIGAVTGVAAQWLTKALVGGVVNYLMGTSAILKAKNALVGFFNTEMTGKAIGKKLSLSITETSEKGLMGSFKTIGSKLGKALSTGLKVAGGIGAVFEAAMIGWDFGTWLDQTFGISDWLAGTQKGAIAAGSQKQDIELAKRVLSDQNAQLEGINKKIAEETDNYDLLMVKQKLFSKVLANEKTLVLSSLGVIQRRGETIDHAFKRAGMSAQALLDERMKAHRLGLTAEEQAEIDKRKRPEEVGPPVPAALVSQKAKDIANAMSKVGLSDITPATAVNAGKAYKALLSSITIALPTKGEIERFKDTMGVVREYKADIQNFYHALEGTGVKLNATAIKGQRGAVTINTKVDLYIDGDSLSEVLYEKFGISNVYKGLDQGPKTINNH